MARKTRNSAKDSGRTNRQEVAGQIRDAIVDGTYGAGDRLPTAEALAEAYGASYVTVLRALEILGEEGFIVSHRRTGTFVAEHPSHLYECGLVLPLLDEPSALDAQPFLKLLVEEARNSGDATVPWRVRPWFLESEGGAQDDFPIGAEHEALVSKDATAGLIFPFDPSRLKGTPLLEKPGIARVTVDRVALPGVSRVTPDHGALLAGALDRVKAAGCSRVAMVICPGLLMDAELKGGEKRLREIVTQRALRMRPYDLISVDLSVDETGLRRMVHMLFDRPAAERPDALVLVDDHFIAPATAGLLDAGVRSPDDLRVMGYCNFPHRPSSFLPIQRFGYDVRVLFHEFIAAIERQRESGKVSHKRLPPAFDDDVS